MPPEKPGKQVETLTHDEAKRAYIPTVEYQTAIEQDEASPLQVAFERRNTDLDPQLVWRGKDVQDWSDLVVQAPPLYIQEKIHPKVLVDDLLRRSRQAKGKDEPEQLSLDLFADFNGVATEPGTTPEFYQHDANWTNRMILGDSLQVMASLAEREGLRGKVQCIYIDPPYGIKFNSNFQWSTTSRDVKDGAREHITREPEQVKAFRDTWRDGIHSYLTYLRDRLTVARDLLTDSGSVFVQIGKENAHRVHALLDEIFGEANFVSLVTFVKTSGQTDNLLASISDYLLWFAKDAKRVKYRQLLKAKALNGEGGTAYSSIRLPDGTTRRLTTEEKQGSVAVPGGARVYRIDNLTSQSPGTRYGVKWHGREFFPKGYWKTQESSMGRLLRSVRVEATANSLYYVRYFADYPHFPIADNWDDTGVAGFSAEKRYVVETSPKTVERCILRASDPGDLVLDPTCGSGTTAFVAEQWGRRWITIDTSRVALALARARIMGARYPFYLLADTPDGRRKEAEVTRTALSERATHGDLRQGFVYERVPHIQLRDIANNAEIDVIWERYQEALEPLREQLNAAAGAAWEEWEVPREADPAWPAAATEAHGAWWQQRIARQKEIDASIAAKAEFEYLYDRPYEDRSKVRVAGPFTVESLSPHRVLGVDEDDELIDGVAEAAEKYAEVQDFATMILDNLRTAGVQQAHKDDRIEFSALTPWPGDLVCAEGRYTEGESGTTRRAAIFIGPEFGTVTRPLLVEAATEAVEAGFDVLIACAFAYDATTTEYNKHGRLPVLKARMNADLHMAADLKNTGSGNLFVIFGEPDIDIISPAEDPAAAPGQIQVRVKGVDVFHPNTGEVQSDGPDGIACWFIDTDYNRESFFVRHAYFLGANDPYQALKTTLKAEINEAAWSTLRSAVSRPFDPPESGRIAVKVINHLGDEVMKVFRVK